MKKIADVDVHRIAQMEACLINCMAQVDGADLRMTALATTRAVS
jgi:hypothetical protein